MSLSTPFIRRPIATTLLMGGVFLVGLMTFPLLPVAPLPQVEFPTIEVTANLPGASPETMATSVATPLESQLSQIAGITQMSSSSSLGSTSITLQFDLDVVMSAAAQDVQSALAAAAGQLPLDLPSPPTYRKANPADTPLMVLSMDSDVLPLTEVTDYANNVVAQQISQLNGVSLVKVHGVQKPAIRVQVDPARLAALGLGMEDVRNVVARATINSPKGSIEGQRQNFAIYANDQLTTAAPYNDLILAYRNGSPIRVRDIGQAIDGPENVRSAAWVNGKRGMAIAIFKQSDSNALATVARVRALIPTLQDALPPAIQLDVLADRTGTIRASVYEVEFHLVLTIALVTLVVFLFLRDVRATLISSVVVPVSIVATFAVMHVLGFSLNNLSLMALTISVGFVIDDAIVMLENIYRHVEAGMKPFEAALKGAQEMGFTILSITLSLVAVFIPVLLMGGIIGRLFREFAITVAVAVLVSALVSLTLVPMLSARFLRPHQPAPATTWRGRFEGMLEGFLTRLERSYGLGLDFVLRHQRATLLSLLLTFALTVIVFIRIPKGFFPQQDTGFISATIEASPDMAYAGMYERMMQVNALIAADPAVATFSSFIGGNISSARSFINLKKRGERDPVPVVMARLRQSVNAIPGVTLFAQARQDLNIGGLSSKTQYQYTLRSADSVELFEWAPRMLEHFRKLPELRDVTSNQDASPPAISLEINRTAAARFGIQADAINRTLYNAFGQRQITQFYTQASQYKIIIEVAPELRSSVAALDTLYIPSPLTGGQVALSTLVTVDTHSTKPLSVNHLSQYPAVTISFNLAPGVALSDAVDAIERRGESIGKPVTLSGRFQGSAQAFQDSLSSQPLLILAAIGAIYIILGMLYESFIHPLTILSTLPSAGLGALLTLWAFGFDLGVIAIIGILLLIGIVKKNAIMMIDFAIEAERDHGKNAYDAIHEACIKRFRPIMMTTLAAMVGGIPLMLGHGDGSELRQPLGYAIVGGLILSQLLTLFTTPVVYLFFDRLVKRRTLAS